MRSRWRRLASSAGGRATGSSKFWESGSDGGAHRRHRHEERHIDGARLDTFDQRDGRQSRVVGDYLLVRCGEQRRPVVDGQAEHGSREDTGDVDDQGRQGAVDHRHWIIEFSGDTSVWAWRTS